MKIKDFHQGQKARLLVRPSRTQSAKRMKKLFILIFAIFLSLSFVSAFESYYHVDLNYDSEKINLVDKKVDFFDVEKENDFGDYVFASFDYSGKVIEANFFEVPNKISYDEINENGTIVSGGEVELDNVNFTLYVPYEEELSYIKIYDSNLDEVLRVDVAEFSKEFEKIKDSEVSGIENITKEELNESLNRENEIPEESFAEKISNYWWVLLVVLIILIIIFLRKWNEK